MLTEWQPSPLFFTTLTSYSAQRGCEPKTALHAYNSK
jgi:hypothetical protein